MAQIEFSGALAGVGYTNTLGTADDLTAGNAELMHFNSITLNDSFGTKTVTNTNNTIADLLQLEQNVSVTINYELKYHDASNIFLAAWLGDAGVPSEVTASQGDYLHTMDYQDTIGDNYVTLAWKVETDQVIEIPSMKVASVVISASSNGVPQVTVTGVADRWLYSGVDSVTNSATDLDGMSAATTLEFAVCNGSTLYARVNAESDGALSSSDDQALTGFTLSWTRNISPGFTFRGANTKYAGALSELSAASMTLELQYLVIDDGSHDPISDLLNQTAKKIEIEFEGAQLGTGTNAGFKFQIPSAKVISKTGYTPTRDNRLTAGAVLQCLEASSAPTGMTGVTNLRLLLTNERSGDYLA